MCQLTGFHNSTWISPDLSLSSTLQQENQSCREKFLKLSSENVLVLSNLWSQHSARLIGLWNVPVWAVIVNHSLWAVPKMTSDHWKLLFFCSFLVCFFFPNNTFKPVFQFCGAILHSVATSVNWQYKYQLYRVSRQGPCILCCEKRVLCMVSMQRYFKYAYLWALRGGLIFFINLVLNNCNNWGKKSRDQAFEHSPPLWDEEHLCKYLIFGFL